MIRVSVLGATGYVGLELIRLLQAHPHVQTAHLISSGHAGEALSSLYPHCGFVSLPKLEELNVETIAADTDVFITSLPHGTSQSVIVQLYKTGRRIIDMSGDFRYDSPQVYSRWYGTAHESPDLLQKSVYGLPELRRDQIRQAKLIGNPGCYTTCAILALAPLVQHGLIDLDSIVIDAKSGSTGAGRKTSQAMHFCETNENFKAYGIAAHRHTSEIEQELGHLAGQEITLSFTPHLLPINRGILATSYAKLVPAATAKNSEDLLALYRNFYENEPFVRIYEAGSFPEIKHVRGSNLACIGLMVDERVGRVIVVSCIDNLIKGAAGQAVQNLNLLYGFEETTGLSIMPWYL